MPRTPKSCFTSSKCTRQASSRYYVMRGAPAAILWQPGSLLSHVEARPAAVGEGVHLFLDDVRRLAGGTLKDLGVLHDRRADLPVSVAGGKFSDQRLQRLPLRRVVGKDVVNSARRLHRRNWASRRWCRL